MKKTLSIFAITAVFAACNNNPKTGNDTVASARETDTATANHNAFTDKAREVQMNGVSDTIVSNDGSTYVKVKPEAAPAKTAPVIKEKSTVRRKTATRSRRASSAGTDAGISKSESSTASNGTSGTSDSSSTETATTTTTTETKKKGWSKAAKGAVIGAGTGAAAGAIISKKKGKGAIIGGIIGATGGYIIGKGKDKKDGRQ